MQRSQLQTPSFWISLTVQLKDKGTKICVINTHNMVALCDHNVFWSQVRSLPLQWSCHWEGKIGVIQSALSSVWILLSVKFPQLAHLSYIQGQEKQLEIQLASGPTYFIFQLPSLKYHLACSVHALSAATSFLKYCL